MSKEITYCMMCLDNKDEVLARLDNVKPYVDRMVVVDGGSKDGTQQELLKRNDLIFINNPWPGVFSEQRNRYLDEVPEYSWCLVSDPDERFPERTLKKLRSWIDMSPDGHPYDMYLLQAVDIDLDYKNDVIRHNRTQWWKFLLFFKGLETRYEGNPHETLLGTGERPIRVRETYEHIKKHGIIWVRGHRNFFINGGGDNLGEKQPLWRPFRELVRNTIDIDSWPEMDRYYKEGNIDLQIKEWLIQHRDHALDNDYNGAGEVREGYKAYFVYYHPEELSQDLIDSDPTDTDYRKEIEIIHGPEKWEKLKLKYE